MAKKLLLLITVAMGTLWFAADGNPALAATFVVNSIADDVDADPGNGTCATAGAVCTLRAAIQEANALAGAGDIITFAASTNGMPITLTLAGQGEDAAATGDLDITAGVTITGNGPTNTIIEAGTLGYPDPGANGIDRVFHVQSGTVGMSSLTVRNGNVPSSGGGILNSGNLTISNSAVTNNSTGSPGGGGIRNLGTLTLNSVTISDNLATSGGGLSVGAGATGALTNVTIANNLVASGGGGILTEAGAGSVALTNVTIAGNSAGSGGGIRSADAGSSVTATNTIVGDNAASTGPDCSTAVSIVSGGHNVIEDTTNCTITGNTAGNITGADPMLAALALNAPGLTETVALLGGSPAVNAADETAAPATDQRGVDRPQGLVSDIGAYEQVPLPAAAGTLLVTSTADAADASPGDGTCATSGGACTLRAAIQEANALPGDGEVITFAASTNGAPITLTIAAAGEDTAATGDLDITGGVTITGNGPDNTIIQPDVAAGGVDRVLHVHTAIVWMSGITIRNGLSGADGGGILNNGTLTLVNSTLSANEASRGGAIANEGALTLDGSTVSDNFATSGGGLSNRDNSSAGLINSTISGNSTAAGGAGLISLAGGTDSFFLTSVTVANNHAQGTGGGIRLADVADTVTLANTILGDNTAAGGGPNCSAATSITSAGYNLIEDTSGCTIGGDTTGNITGDPMLGPLALNAPGLTATHALLAGSPALNAASPGCPPPSTDQRGVARPQSGACDIGAYEFQTVTPTPSPTATSTQTASPTPTATPVGQTPSPTPTPTPVGQTPSPTPVGQTPSPTPTPTPVGQTSSPTPVGQTPSPTPTATPIGQTPSPTPVGQTPTPTPTATPSGQTPTPTLPPGGLIQGNVDCRPPADSIDALQLLLFVAHLPTNQADGCPAIDTLLATFALVWGDVNCDGEVNSVDALLILLFVAHLPYTLPAGCPDIGEALA